MQFPVYGGIENSEVKNGKVAKPFLKLLSAEQQAVGLV